jgi:hypothetical protein
MKLPFVRSVQGLTYRGGSATLRLYGANNYQEQLQC